MIAPLLQQFIKKALNARQISLGQLQGLIIEVLQLRKLKRIHFLQFNSSQRHIEFILFTNQQNKLNQRRFQILYNQILQEYLNQQQYMYHNKKQLKVILQNIICFSGGRFYGQLFTGTQCQIPIEINLKHIGSIIFTNLKFLNLSNCGLTNIQQLTWLNAKSISSLQLDKNQIVSLNSHSKISFPQLNSFSIIGNDNDYLSYHSFNYIQRLHSPKMQIMICYYQQNQQSDNLFDMRFIVKLQISSNQLDENKRFKIGCDQLNGGKPGNKFKSLITNHSPLMIFQCS